MGMVMVRSCCIKRLKILHCSDLRLIYPLFEDLQACHHQMAADKNYHQMSSKKSFLIPRISRRIPDVGASGFVVYLCILQQRKRKQVVEPFHLPFSHRPPHAPIWRLQLHTYQLVVRLSDTSTCGLTTME